MIDAVGMEAAHGHGALHAAERVKQATALETDRGHALRDAILACRPGGIVSVIGVYGGLMDKFPTGAFMNKGLTIKSGPVPRPALHQAALRAHQARATSTRASWSPTGWSSATAPDGYETFKHKQDDCVKVVLKP